jgi:hypothetical protein
MPPGVPQLGKTMAEQNGKAAPGFDDVHLDAIRTNVFVNKLHRKVSSMVKT